MLTDLQRFRLAAARDLEREAAHAREVAHNRDEDDDVSSIVEYAERRERCAAQLRDVAA